VIKRLDRFDRACRRRNGRFTWLVLGQRSHRLIAILSSSRTLSPLLGHARAGHLFRACIDQFSCCGQYERGTDFFVPPPACVRSRFPQGILKSRAMWPANGCPAFLSAALRAIALLTWRFPGPWLPGIETSGIRVRTAGRSCASLPELGIVAEFRTHNDAPLPHPQRRGGPTTPLRSACSPASW